MKKFLFLFFSLPALSYGAESAIENTKKGQVSHCSNSECRNCGKLNINGSQRNYTSFESIITFSVNESDQKNINKSKDGLYDLTDIPYKQRIQEIDASHNSISKLNPTDLDDFSHLRILLLASVNLVTLNTTAFHKPFRLTHLDLSGNTLKFLPHGIFDTLSHLKELLVHDNELETVPEDLFLYNRKLSSFDAHNNQLKKIPTSLFHLSIKENKSGKKTKRKIYTRKINLSGNSLTCLDQSLTRDIKKIYLLDIQNNFFKECPVQKTQDARTKNLQSPITTILCNCPYGNHKIDVSFSQLPQYST
ncbi:hypothetical protein K9K77_00125 [Candidatus Babeliales bacterium]|nr:hypothetical protein [Candidatus Babeliales bacterium]